MGQLNTCAAFPKWQMRTMTLSAVPTRLEVTNRPNSIITHGRNVTQKKLKSAATQLMNMNNKEIINTFLSDKNHIHFKQLKNREEWLKNRGNYIGGSEASAIIGLNPYMSNLELWQIKIGLLIPDDISDKPYVQYGTDAEKYLRELFKLNYPQYEVFYVENNSFTNDKYPFAAASLDGMLIEKETGRKGILEIKTTNILQSMQKENWKDRIPDNYYCQVLWYLGVTEYDFAILKAELRSTIEGETYLQTKHYRIERSEVEEDIKQIMNEAAKFWEYVKKRKKPPLLLPEI